MFRTVARIQSETNFGRRVYHSSSLCVPSVALILQTNSISPAATKRHSPGYMRRIQFSRLLYSMYRVAPSNFVCRQQGVFRRVHCDGCSRGLYGKPSSALLPRAPRRCVMRERSETIKERQLPLPSSSQTLSFKSFYFSLHKTEYHGTSRNHL